MTATMRAIDIRGGKGPRENLFLSSNIPKPTPKSGEALVKVKAFGINRMDQIQRNGAYPLPPGVSSILGVEFSGTVDSLADEGTDSSRFKVGDEVFGLAYGGAYAEYVAVDVGMLMPKPAFLSWEQAAGVPETWITAIQALHVVGEFQPGKAVLWHAGASGVSIAGIQLSLDAGAGAVYATAGTEGKCSFITGTLGATKAFNYKTEDWAKGIKDATGGSGVDLVVDFIGGGDYFTKNIDVAARDGRIAMLGMMGGGIVENVDIRPILFKRVRIEGTTLRSRTLEYQGKLREKLESYLPDFENGKLKVVIDTVLPWDQIQKAHEILEGNQNSGKIVCTIP
ncbi:hypothetical protein BN1723_005006 [Verticillium longisporum]|uniref:Quinone oxidoreductase n=3 Tax=Verticillium TaxID=1036719 RepID=G2XER7_VERDV|nr:quinone oxidoreductase [Verticillium dahliae VdLs.17]KAF3345235.1 hypothetical protein VdG2_06646 [Verticillium dahliae VDG2]RXG47453.1 hypothetical protein VDGE_08652 [Verticillium dahliae]CRK34391.1 hypothetical protein BN1708_006364 [Verticillium longisporum]EGY18318.1 quinone oxidoreductase [Verticillium dahliae VdLs.17]CRK41065.1 hypothetical protein BN1723_005006 [Verticillium longisporum]